jgi:ADP-ribosyl-[dinitrogen reductase] hydrolase
MDTSTSRTVLRLAEAARTAIGRGASSEEIAAIVRVPIVPESIATSTDPSPAAAEATPVLRPVITVGIEGSSTAHAFRGTTVTATIEQGGVVIEASVMAVDAPDDRGDRFDWDAASGTVTRNGVSLPAIGTVGSARTPRRPAEAALATGYVVVAVPLDVAEHPDDLAELIDDVGAGTNARAWPVSSASYALCLLAAGEVDAVVVDATRVSSEVPAGGRREGADVQGAMTMVHALGGEVRSVGPIVVAGRGRVDERIAPRLLEVRRRREYRATPAPVDVDEALRPVHLQRGRRVHDAGRLARAHGCMLGQAAGDALGQLVEFSHPATIAQSYPDGGPRLLVDGGTWHTIAGQPTDDTEMALCLARAIVHAGGFDREATARAYMRWGTGDLPATLPAERDGARGTRPYDIGDTTAKAVRAPTAHDVQAGTVAHASARIAERSIPANGALMRVSPLGVWGAGRDRDEVARLARADAALTHGHPFTQAASAAYAVAISHAIWTGAEARETWRVALDIARGPHGDPKVATVIAAADDGPPDDFMHHMGGCATALRNAFFRLLHARTLEEGVVATVRAGGDTDTTGAIAGALLGAVYGRETIPAQWRQMVLTCRPLARADGSVQHPRPRCLWPVDALALAERLLLAGR